MTRETKLPFPPKLVHPDELRRVAEEKEMFALREAVEAERKREEEQKKAYRAFFERHLQPAEAERFSQLVRQAAAEGKRTAEVLRFSSEWCTDNGRAINNGEADWPQTLTGFAREAHEAYEEVLRPLGYKMRAQIVTFPKGIPGDVALYISW